VNTGIACWTGAGTSFANAVVMTQNFIAFVARAAQVAAYTNKEKKKQYERSGQSQVFHDINIQFA